MAEPIEIDRALKSNDPVALAKAAPKEELERIKAAEELLRLSRERTAPVSKWPQVSQGIVAVVAVAGMLVNAYQSYVNKVQTQEQTRTDQERWAKEFERAQRADKYRAFFETSVLATDPTNADKRLVGYALLQEFVDDADYNTKATLMLEESLMQELRSNTNVGLDEAHRNAVTAILTALAESPDCQALGRAARSIERIVERHSVQGDLEETGQIFGLYVHRLYGHAALVCKTYKDQELVRRPLAEALERMPGIVGASGHMKRVEANTRIAQILVERCSQEIALSGTSDCPRIYRQLASTCPDHPDEKPGCEIYQAAAASNPVPAASAHNGAGQGGAPAKDSAGSH